MTPDFTAEVRGRRTEIEQCVHEAIIPFRGFAAASPFRTKEKARI